MKWLYQILNWCSVLTQRESVLEFSPIAWNIMKKVSIPKCVREKFSDSFSGLVFLRVARGNMKPVLRYSISQSRNINTDSRQELDMTLHKLMKQPYLNQMLKPTIRNLEDNISQMISFIDTELDLQPWERWAMTSYNSDSEAEVNLMSLMRDMLGHASVPAIFGSAIMEKYPSLLHDVYDLDGGFYFFLMSLPAWTPWPGVMKAHVGRYKAWEALDDLQRALDALADGNPIDPSWGELDDVSDFIMERHAIFKS